MSVIQFPNKKKEEKPAPLLGDICFNWSDVELVEATKTGNTRIHFKSGKIFNSNMPFAEGRKRYLNGRKTNRK